MANFYNPSNNNNFGGNNFNNNQRNFGGQQNNDPILKAMMENQKQYKQIEKGQKMNKSICKHNFNGYNKLSQTNDGDKLVCNLCNSVIDVSKTDLNKLRESLEYVANSVDLIRLLNPNLNEAQNNELAHIKYSSEVLPTLFEQYVLPKSNNMRTFGANTANVTSGNIAFPSAHRNYMPQQQQPQNNYFGQQQQQPQNNYFGQQQQGFNQMQNPYGGNNNMGNDIYNKSFQL